MSDRLPQGSLEFWLQFNLASETHTAYSSMGFLYDPPTTPLELTDLQTLLLSMSESFASALTSEWTCGPGYLLVGNDDEPVRVDGTGTATGGLLDTESLPPNCAYILKKTTNLGGRRGRGRMYIPGCAEPEVAANGALSLDQIGLLEDVITAVATEVDTFLGASGLDTMVGALLHNLLRDENGDPIPGSGLPPTPLTSLVPESKIGTQRRRMARS